MKEIPPANKEDLFSEVLSFEAEELRLTLELDEHKLSEEVKEAFRILIRVAEIFADSSISLEEQVAVLFKELSRTQIAEARDLVARWREAEKIRAPERERRRWTRRKQKGIPEAQRLDNRTLEQTEDMDTQDILDAVDRLDEVCSVLFDGIEEGEPLPRCSLRDKLLELHRKAFSLAQGGGQATKTDLGLFDLAWEVECMLRELLVGLEGIQKVVHEVTDMSLKDARTDES